jgi:16S rRNA (guanine527-N7)-methyltransferase
MSAEPAPAPPDSRPVTDAESFAAATGAAPAAVRDLVRYRELLEDWNGKMNLVGPSALAEYWPRHVYDSAQLHLLRPEARVWADLGAGAGFPGLVLAILLKDAPGAQVHLVESLQKRCRFLQAVVDELELPATVHAERAESLKLYVDIVTARACAPLPRLLGYAEPYLDRGAVGLFLKGQDVVSELTEATKSWIFKAETVPSLSSATGRVLEVKELSRVR